MTEPIPTWAWSEAGPLCTTPIEADESPRDCASCQHIARALVERDRAGFARGIEAAANDIDVLVRAGVGVVPGTRINVVQAMANGIRIIPYSGPTGDDGPKGEP